jgi:hypothetical protein
MERIGHTRAAGFFVDKNYTGTNYDYRGYFAKHGGTPVGAGQHLTDEFKLPSHPTFSVESRFARGRDKRKAGHWAGDTFVPPSSLRDVARKAVK